MPCSARRPAFRTQRPIGTIRPVSSASGMNCAGGSMPIFGMGPAQQRLDAGDLPGRQVHLRLVVQRELVALQRMAQGVFQRQPLDRLHLHFLGEEAEIVLAVFLGEIHRHVGILGQRMHVGAVGREHGDADAGRGVAFVAAQLHRLADRRQQLARDSSMSSRSASVRGSRRIRRRRAAPRYRSRAGPRSRSGHFHQQGVAGLMAERIVDDLEAVEIDEQHRELPLVAMRRHRSRNAADG